MLGFPIPENEPNLHGNLISVNVPQMAMMPLTTKFIGSSSGFHDLKHKSHRFYHCDMLQTQRGNKCKIYYNFRDEKKISFKRQSYFDYPLFCYILNAASKHFKSHFKTA